MRLAPLRVGRRARVSGEVWQKCEILPGPDGGPRVRSRGTMGDMYSDVKGTH